MTKLFVAFSHTLTEEQREGARIELGVQEIVTLSDVAPALQQKMSQVDPEATAEDLRALAHGIVDTAVDEGATHFYSAGEPALTFYMWSIALESRSLEVVQSTTKRESIEETDDDGNVIKKSVFRHVQWRRIFDVIR